MSEPNGKNRVVREARLRWVPITLMKFPALAQRDQINQARVDHLAASFDPERLGSPTVNHRDGHFYVLDGMHRVSMLRQIGWGDQQIQCWAYEGLSEQDEAEIFLSLNDTLAVDAFNKFRVGVNAGREVECDIDRIVRAHDLNVGRDRGPGSIRAVGTLRRIYTRSGPAVLARTLRIVRDAYGDSGMEAVVLDGIGLLCQRYNGELEDQLAVAKLGKIHGGVNGLLGRAEKIRRDTHLPKGQCVAAAAVEVVNQGRGGKKLPSWFREAA